MHVDFFNVISIDLQCFVISWLVYYMIASVILWTSASLWTVVIHTNMMVAISRLKKIIVAYFSM